MRSTITFGAFLLISTVWALPFLPRIPSGPSSSLVKRYSNPLSLLPRSTLPQEPGPDRYKNWGPRKGLPPKATKVNPVVASIWESEPGTLRKFLTRRIEWSSLNLPKPTLPQKPKGEQGLPAAARSRNPIVKSLWGKRQEPKKPLCPATQQSKNIPPSDTLVTTFTNGGPVVEHSSRKRNDATAPSPSTEDKFFEDPDDPCANAVGRGWKAQTANWAVINGYRK
ncbi:MAG: hypothetical protein Q9182_007337 [Xanthomendoza sp. 2 TL-2023]